MRKITLAGIVIALVAVFVPNAFAAPPTDVEASNSTIYPYVNGGRADSSTISWFADGAVDIYVNGDFVASRGSDVSSWPYNGFVQTPNVGAPGHPGDNSNNPGDYNAGATSTDANVCVVEKDSALGDLLGACTTVTVRRVYEVTSTNERSTKIGMKGNRFAKRINSNCSFEKRNPGLFADCRAGRARVFYRTGLPFLAPGEFIAGAWETVKYWDGGDGFHSDSLIGNDSRVRVKLQEGFLGQIRRVRVDFNIDADDSVTQH